MATSNREHFGGRMAVLFAMAGSAIGLGNIWRFPYMVGEHGGAAFIILYLAAMVFITLPIFFSEVVIGRRSGQGAFNAMTTLRPGRPVWKFFGSLGILIPTWIACFYSVVGGWSIAFFFKSLAGEFAKSGTETVNTLFPAFVSSGWAPVVCHLLFMAISAAVVACGVRSGIEKFSKSTIPVLFVLILLMAVYSVFLPGAQEGINYLIHPDFSTLSPRDFAYAMGQSFFSLSVGAGTIVTYGSYVSKKENILISGGGTALFDFFFAILAGFAIMPAIFAAGLKPSCGPGLVFQGIPYIFAEFGKEMPVLSYIVCLMFFFTIVVAAMTSLVSLLEVGVSFLIEHYGVKRWKASLSLAVLCGGTGCICALSEKALSIFDWFSSNIMVPTLALAVVIFTGFIMKKDDVRDELTNCGTSKLNCKIFGLVYFLIRWIAPPFIIVIFITNFVL